MDFSGWFSEYSGVVFRIVESQEKVATMMLVDSLEEQALLEELIEESKPAIGQGKGRHYLITTPFRYPPLKHGSRFGSRFEPSIFYAGTTLDAAMCESAFYSFYFMSRSTVPYQQVIKNHKTSFSVKIQDKQHLDLTVGLGADLKEQLTHKFDYQFTQSIGKRMRQHEVASFRFFSARCDGKVNIGVFDMNVIADEPTDFKNWEVKQSSQDIVFYCPLQPQLSQAFHIDTFLVDGVLPMPST